MQLNKDQIIAIQTTLIGAGYMPSLSEGVTPSGEWTHDTQVGFDHYLQNHEELMAEQMVGKQPGNMEQLGATLGHAIDHGISLFDSAAKKLKHWFVSKKATAVIEAERLAAEAKVHADKLVSEAHDAEVVAKAKAAQMEAEALAEAARLEQTAKEKVAAAEVEAQKLKDAAVAEAKRIADAAATAAEASKDNAPAPKEVVVVAPSTEAQASAPIEIDRK